MSAVRATDLRCGVLLASCAVLLWSSNAAAQTSPVVARAAGVTGRVMLSNGNGLPPLALTRGYALNPGDRVDTRGGGRLVVELSDGSMVVVLPESVLVLKDFRAAASLRELFEITLGLVRVKVNHFGGRPNPYRMNSPTASIAVRGTEFNVVVASEGDTNVEVFEGAVEVSSLADPGSKALIEAGKAVLVRPGQAFRFYMAPPRRELGKRGRHPDPGRLEVQKRADGKPIIIMAAPAAGENKIPPNPNQATPPSPVPLAPPPAGEGVIVRRVFEAQPELRRSYDGESTYERYIGGLSDLSDTPFLYRFGAFPEPHLDSLENPAYATDFRTAEGRMFFVPALASSGGEMQSTGYSFSPQVSLFTPVGGRMVAGGSVAASHAGYSPIPGIAPFQGATTSRGDFWSTSAILARRVGKHNSIGFGVERLRGDGSLGTDYTFLEQGTLEHIESVSRISQTRLTAGVSRDIARDHRLGLWFRYGLIQSSDAERSQLLAADLVSRRSRGHSSEIGFRLRGLITPRLSYGVTGSWLGLSLADSGNLGAVALTNRRDGLARGAGAVGFGYALGRGTLLSADLAAGVSHADAARTEAATGLPLDNSTGRNRFGSLHLAIHRDIGRRFFVNASTLSVWRSRDAIFLLYPGRTAGGLTDPGLLFPPIVTATQSDSWFPELGAGWRFSPNVIGQYLWSPNYGSRSGSHAIMVRYTFRFRGQ